MLIYFLTYLMSHNSPMWSGYLQYSYLDLGIELMIGLMVSWTIIEISTKTAYWLEYRLPWTSSPLLRFILQLLLTILAMILLLVIQDLLFCWYYLNKIPGPQQQFNFSLFFIVSILVSIFVSTVHTGYFFLQRWKTALSEAAQLNIKTLEFKKIAMQWELQSLKLQLDPHFMFNNFSTLSELIKEDPLVASTFLDNLSRVYRYMIQNIKKDLVHLRNEITFVNAYVYLIKIRYGNNVQITIDLNEKELEYEIPPITLQMLIENAIKHNIATVNQPLHIQISCNEHYIKTTNNLQLMGRDYAFTGMGLQNITDRYRILSGNLPVIKETPDVFTVLLPILN